MNTRLNDNLARHHVIGLLHERLIVFLLFAGLSSFGWAQSFGERVSGIYRSTNPDLPVEMLIYSDEQGFAGSIKIGFERFSLIAQRNRLSLEGAFQDGDRVVRTFNFRLPEQGLARVYFAGEAGPVQMQYQPFPDVQGRYVGVFGELIVKRRGGELLGVYRAKGSAQRLITGSAKGLTLEFDDGIALYLEPDDDRIVLETSADIYDDIVKKPYTWILGNSELADFTDLQTAMNSLPEQVQLSIEAGEYTGNVLVKQALRLVGPAHGRAVIVSEQGVALTWQANGSVQNITVQSSDRPAHAIPGNATVTIDGRTYLGDMRLQTEFLDNQNCDAAAQQIAQRKGVVVTSTTLTMGLANCYFQTDQLAQAQQVYTTILESSSVDSSTSSFAASRVEEISEIVEQREAESASMRCMAYQQATMTEQSFESILKCRGVLLERYSRHRSVAEASAQLLDVMRAYVEKQIEENQFNQAEELIAKLSVGQAQPNVVRELNQTLVGARSSYQALQEDIAQALETCEAQLSAAYYDQAKSCYLEVLNKYQVSDGAIQGLERAERAQLAQQQKRAKQKAERLRTAKDAFAEVIARLKRRHNEMMAFYSDARFDAEWPYADQTRRFMDELLTKVIKLGNELSSKSNTSPTLDEYQRLTQTATVIAQIAEQDFRYHHGLLEQKNQVEQQLEGYLGPNTLLDLKKLSALVGEHGFSERFLDLPRQARVLLREINVQADRLDAFDFTLATGDDYASTLKSLEQRLASPELARLELASSRIQAFIDYFVMYTLFDNVDLLTPEVFDTPKTTARERTVSFIKTRYNSALDRLTEILALYPRHLEASEFNNHAVHDDLFGRFDPVSKWEYAQYIIGQAWGAKQKGFGTFHYQRTALLKAEMKEVATKFVYLPQSAYRKNLLARESEFKFGK